MTTLTQCQQQVLDMLISYQKERGFPPTNQEVATMLGYRSVIWTTITRRCLTP